MDEYPVTQEQITSSEDLVVYRLKAPGGWIVSVRDLNYSTSSSFFVPNSDHNWVLES